MVGKQERGDKARLRAKQAKEVSAQAWAWADTKVGLWHAKCVMSVLLINPRA